MKLSRYFQQVELKNNIYAIFNSLVMDVLYVNKEKLDEIISKKVTEEEQEKLLNIGI